MKIKYCLPIIKESQKEVYKSLNTNGYDFYEIWLDYIKDLNVEFISKVCTKYKGKIIFLFRRKNLEKNKLSLKDKLSFIEIILNHNVLLDLDFLSQNDELEFAIKNKGKARLIVSHHDYKKTPSLDNLKNLVSKMQRYNPDIIKIATQCNDKKDSLVLLSLLLELKNRNIKHIVLGMGNEGILTRIVATIWGNEFIFAPKDLKEKSAKGQLTKKQLEDIFSKL